MVYFSWTITQTLKVYVQVGAAETGGSLCSQRRGITAAKCVFGKESAVKLTLVSVSSV